MAVSLSSAVFFYLPIRNGVSRCSRFAVTNDRVINSCYINQSKNHRKVVCACVAPPRNLKGDDSSAIKFNVISAVPHCAFFFLVNWVVCLCLIGKAIFYYSCTTIEHYSYSASFAHFAKYVSMTSFEVMLQYTPACSLLLMIVYRSFVIEFCLSFWKM